MQAGVRLDFAKESELPNSNSRLSEKIWLKLGPTAIPPVRAMYRDLVGSYGTRNIV
jgi:hypothetical protein